jgi:hypothetical protein
MESLALPKLQTPIKPLFNASGFTNAIAEIE